MSYFSQPLNRGTNYKEACINGVTNVLCDRCEKFVPKDNYPRNFNFSVSICSDCFAKDYKEEVIDTYSMLYDICNISNEKLKDILNEEELAVIQKIKENLLDNMSSTSEDEDSFQFYESPEHSCEEELINDNDLEAMALSDLKP